LKSCCVLQDHYDDERDKTVFHNTTPDLQDQDQDNSVQDQDQDLFFGLRPLLSYDRRSQTSTLLMRIIDSCQKLQKQTEKKNSACPSQQQKTQDEPKTSP